MAINVAKVRPAKLLGGEGRKVRGITSNIDAVKLLGEKFKGSVTDAVTEATLERSIEVASSIEITVHDPEGKLRQSKLLDRRYDIELDDLWFRFVGLRRQTRTELTLVHEDREISRFRQVKGPAKALRDKVTRAEFIVGRWLKAPGPKIPIWVPELHTVQPIENARQGKEAKREVEITRGKGLDGGASLTVKGVKANSEQMNNGDRVLRVGASLNAPRAALVASIATGIAENSMSNGAGGLGTSDGYFQILDSTAANLHIDKGDLEQCAHVYFTKGFTTGIGAIGYAKQGLGPAAISGAVQGNAAGAASYAPFVGEAEKWVDAFAGGSGTLSGSVTTTLEKPYSFEQGKDEDSWEMAGRLTEEVDWRRFVANGVAYLIAETDLLESRVSMRVNDDAPGIDEITFDWDHGKKVDEVTVVGRARTWAAPPGTVAMVEGQGPADGRYIVSSIRSPLAIRRGTGLAAKGLGPADVEVTLNRPQKPLPEPAPETVTKTDNFSIDLGNGGGGGGTIDGIDFSRGGWGGTEAIFLQVLDPLARQMGLSIGGRKEGGHAVGGDHDPSVRNAFACDYGTYNGQAFAVKVCQILGVPTSTVGTFNKPTFRVGSRVFGCQVLWNVPDHHDHCHVGVRAGGY